MPQRLVYPSTGEIKEGRGNRCSENCRRALEIKLLGERCAGGGPTPGGAAGTRRGQDPPEAPRSAPTAIRGKKRLLYTYRHVHTSPYRRAHPGWACCGAARGQCSSRRRGEGIKIRHEAVLKIAWGRCGTQPRPGPEFLGCLARSAAPPGPAARPRSPAAGSEGRSREEAPRRQLFPRFSSSPFFRSPHPAFPLLSSSSFCCCCSAIGDKSGPGTGAHAGSERGSVTKVALMAADQRKLELLLE